MDRLSTLLAMALMAGLVAFATTNMSAQLQVDLSKTDANNANLDNAAIDLTVQGGSSPYTFEWTTGATSEDLTGLGLGRYTVTVTDMSQDTVCASTTVLGKVFWADLDSVAVDGDTLVRVGNRSSWFSGAGSHNILLPGGDGCIEYGHSTSDVVAIGLTRDREGPHYVYIDYCFYLNSWMATIYKDGAFTGMVTSVVDGDVFNISRKGDHVYFRYGSLVLDSLATDLSDTLVVDACITMPGEKIRSLKASFGPPALMAGPAIVRDTEALTADLSVSGSGGVPPYSYQWGTGASTPSISGVPYATYRVTVTDAIGQDVAVDADALYPIDWTNLENVSRSGSVLTKTSVAGWDGGAASKNMLAAGQRGFIEYVVPDTDGRFIGLSDEDVSAANGTIGYAFSLFHPYLVIWELGNMASQSTYAIGDTLRIERNNGKILYYCNGLLLKETTANCHTGLMADISIYSQGSALGGLKASFSYAPMKNLVSIDGEVSSSLFSLSSEIIGGACPYTRFWSNGGSRDTNLLFMGNPYGLVVLDSLKDTLRQNISVRSVLWGGQVDISVTGDTIAGDLTATGWDSHAISQDFLNPGEDGLVYHSILSGEHSANSSKDRMFGISPEGHANDNKPYYGFLFEGTSYKVMENGSQVGPPATFNAGTPFQVIRCGNELSYLVDGATVQRTWHQGLSNEKMYVAVAFRHDGAYFDNIVSSYVPPLSFDFSYTPDSSGPDYLFDLTVSGGASPYNIIWDGQSTTAPGTLASGVYDLEIEDAFGSGLSGQVPILNENIYWQDVSGCTIQADRVTCTSAPAIAISHNKLLTGIEGAVQMEITGMATAYNNSGFGFSETKGVLSSHGLDFGFYFENGIMFKIDSGNISDELGAFALDDIFLLITDDNYIHYKKNGVDLCSADYDPQKEYKAVAKIDQTNNYLDGIRTSFVPHSISLEGNVTHVDGAINGTVSITPIGGVPPYTYQWGHGASTAQLDNLLPGEYGVTVTGQLGLTATASYFVMDNVGWKFTDNCTIVSGVLEKTTTGSAWDCMAITKYTLGVGENGCVAYTIENATEYKGRRCFGLAGVNSRTLPMSLHYGFYLEEDRVKLYCGGTQLGDYGQYAASDQFVIEKLDGTVSFYKNGALLESVALVSDMPLVGKALLYDDSSTFEGFWASFAGTPYTGAYLKTEKAGTVLAYGTAFDAGLTDADADSLFSASQHIQASSAPPGNKVRSILAFDIVEVPQGAVVKSAELKLFGVSHEGVNQAQLCPITGAWTDTIGWGNQPAFTTTGATTLPASTTTDQDYTVDIRGIVQAWADGAMDNNGLLLKLADEGTAGRLQFASRDYTPDSLKWPQLEVSYYMPVNITVEISPAVDATVKNTSPGTNFGADTTFAASAGGGATSRSLLWFDLSAIPPNARVDSAYFYMTGQGHDGDNASTLYPIAGPWHEDSVTWDNQPAWSGMDSVNTGALASNGTGANDLKKLVQLWAEGTIENHGLMLRLQDESGTKRAGFVSSDSPDTTSRPKLVVHYSAQPLEVLPKVEEGTRSGEYDIDIEIAGGVPPYTITWPNGETTMQMRGLTASSCQVVVTDAWGSMVAMEVDDYKEGQPPTYSANALPTDLNWKRVKTYTYADAASTSTTVAESVVYLDKFGRGTQTISKIFTKDDPLENNKVLVSQTLYDEFGRPAVKSLPAVVEQNGLGYVDNFMTNVDNGPYSASDFEYSNDGERVKAPDKVSDDSWLGQYYSNNNTMEPYVPSAEGYPFTQVEYSKTQTGAVRRSAAAGAHHHLGTGHGSQSYSMVTTSDELFPVYGYSGWIENGEFGMDNDEYTDVFGDYSFFRSKTLVKSVNIDPEGKQSILYKDMSGNTIASCMAGESNGDTSLERTVLTKISPYQGYIDIHVAPGCEQSLVLDYQIEGMSYSIIDLQSDQVVYDHLSFLEILDCDFKPTGFSPLNYSSSYPPEEEDWTVSERWLWYVGLYGYDYPYHGCDPGCLDGESDIIIDDEEFVLYNDIIEKNGDSFEYEYIYKDVEGERLAIRNINLKIKSLDAGIYRIIAHRPPLSAFNQKDLFIYYDIKYHSYALNYFDEAGRLTKTVTPMGVDYEHDSELTVHVDSVASGITTIYEEGFGLEGTTVPFVPFLTSSSIVETNDEHVPVGGNNRIPLSFNPNSEFQFIQVFPEIDGTEDLILLDNSHTQYIIIGECNGFQIYNETGTGFVMKNNQSGELKGNFLGNKKFVISEGNLIEVEVVEGTVIHAETRETIGTFVQGRATNNPMDKVDEFEQLYNYSPSLNKMTKAGFPLKTSKNSGNTSSWNFDPPFTSLSNFGDVEVFEQLISVESDPGGGGGGSFYEVGREYWTQYTMDYKFTFDVFGIYETEAGDKTIKIRSGMVREEGMKEYFCEITYSTGSTETRRGLKDKVHEGGSFTIPPVYCRNLKGLEFKVTSIAYRHKSGEQFNAGGGTVEEFHFMDTGDLDEDLSDKSQVYQNKGYYHFSDLSKYGVQFKTISRQYSNSGSNKISSDLEYNSFNQLEKSMQTDRDTTRYVYNSMGQIKFSQNALQEQNNSFSYWHYDRAGRLMETGEYDNSQNLYTFQSLTEYLDDTTNQYSVHKIVDNIYDQDNDLADGLSHQYCNDETWYEYDIPDPAGLDAHVDIANFQQQFVSGRLSKTYNANSKTWYSYDEWGQVEWVVNKLAYMPEEKTIHYEYDFLGNVTSVMYQKFDNGERFDHQYEYDADMRMARVSTIEYEDDNGILVVNTPEEQAEYKFYKHGPLKRVELGENLQGIDYVYTINGQLKSINSPNLGDEVDISTFQQVVLDPGKDGTNGFSPDMFGMSIDYHTGDYIREGTYINFMEDYSGGYFNGLIKSIRWNTENDLKTGLAENQHWAYTYDYDHKYRLKGADFGKYDLDLQQNKANRTYSSSNMYFGMANEISLPTGLLNKTGTTDPQQFVEAVSKAVSSAVPSMRGDLSYYNTHGASSGGAHEMATGQNTQVSFTNSEELRYFNVNNKLNATLTANEVDISGLGQGFYSNIQLAFSNNYKVSNISYDMNGNILSLDRNSYGTSNVMDRLEYDYTCGTNKLARVNDQASSSLAGELTHQPDASNYTYNTIGNITGNKDENQFYTYNHLQQVTAVYVTQADAVNQTNPVASYHYDEFGRRVKKTVYADQNTVTFYQRFAGALAAIYIQQGGAPVRSEMLINGAGCHGVVHFSGDDLQDFRYELTDHLGNVRATVGKDANGDAELKSYTDYYPFGMVMPGRNWVGADQHRYGYQGQFAEHDPETGLNHFLLRDFDPRLGRWLKTDPFYQFHSPYNGMGNNPVMGVDPLGGETKHVDIAEVVVFAFKPSVYELFAAFYKDFLDTHYYEEEYYGDEYYIHGVHNWKGGGCGGGGGGGGGGSRHSGGSSSYRYHHRRANDGTGNTVMSVPENYEQVMVIANDGDVYITPLENAQVQGGFDLGDGLSVTGKVNSVANGFYSSVAKNSGNSTIGSNGYTYFARNGQRGFYGNQYVTTKSLSSVGRASKFLGPAGHAISLGQVGYGVYQDGGTFGYNAQVATGSAVGGFAGGLAGAKAGAVMGGAIGAFFGVVGAVPGAIIGGFVGGVVGGFYGGKAGEAAVNYYY